LRELKNLHKHVPDDVAVVSIGQMSAFDLLEPPVTSICLPSSEIGDKAVDILLRNIKETILSIEKVSLKTELVVRKSCGAH
jgi:LacI family transcriptional regulator